MEEIFEGWEDDERMRALFNEFRPKNVNPEGWKNKMSTWTAIVTLWCRKSKAVLLTSKDLRCAFERKGLFPQCLQPVIQQMFREGIFQDYENVASFSSSQSWINWGVNIFVKKPIFWGWSAVSDYIYGKTEESSEKKFIYMPLLKELSASLLEKLESKVEFEARSISLKECQDIYNEVCLQEESLNLVLNYLQSLKNVLLFEESGSQYVKVFSGHEEKAMITEKDVGLLRLQKAFLKVQEEVENLRNDIQSCTNQAKAAVKIGQKSKAQEFLRRRKCLEKAMEQKIGTSDQLERMIDKLKNSSTDQQVIGALSAGLRAQKAIVGAGIGINDVENTMANIQETYEEQEEISDFISRPVGFTYDSGDSALEEELNELLSIHKKENKERTVRELLMEPTDFILPDVPKSSPTAVQISPKRPSECKMPEI